MRRLFLTAVTVLSAAALGGCGNKGPLVLPPRPNVPAASSVAAPAAAGTVAPASSASVAPAGSAAAVPAGQ